MIANRLRHRFRVFLAALGLLSACILGAPLCPAQVDGESQGEPIDPVLTAQSPDGRVLIVDAAYFHFFREGDAWIVLLHGNVEIQYDDTRVFAESIVLWYDYTESQQLLRILREDDFRYGYQIPAAVTGLKPIPIGPLPYGGTASLDPPSTEDTLPWAGDPMEFYAEGRVKIVQGEVSFHCDQAYTNLLEKRGLLLSAEVFGTGDISKKKHPLHFKAASIKKVCDELHCMEDLSFSTCVFGVPHYELHVDRAELMGSFEDGLLSIEGPSVEVRGVPLPLPDSSFRIGRNWYFPVKSVKVGSSSRFGQYAFITLEENFDRLGNSVHSALGLSQPFSGDIELDIQAMTKRGLGVGPKLEYESEGLYRGEMEGYFINDSADKDRGDVPIDENKRGRVRTQNRINVGKDTLLDLELSYITDDHFLDEYFEDELKTEKEQETYTYLHHESGSNAWSLLSSFRLNDFDTQNEYLPQARWDLTSIPLAGGSQATPILGIADSWGIFYDHRTEFGQVRNRPADDLTDPSERITRADYIGTFEAPLTIGYFQVTPFYENRLSYFERTLNESEAAGRYVESFGTKAGFVLHSHSDFSNDLLNINGLRNILAPSVVYKNSFAINKESDELIPFDSVEDPRRGETVTLTLHHRLQTKGLTANRPTHTLYEALFELPVYRDYRLSDTRHRLGDLSYFTWLTPQFVDRWFKNMVISHRGVYNPNDKLFTKHNSMMTIRPHEDYAVGVSHGWIRNTQEEISGIVRRILTDKWEMEVGLRYDLKESKTNDRFVTLRRRAHQWLFELSVSVDKGDDDTSVNLSITPLALFSNKIKGSIYDPMQMD